MRSSLDKPDRAGEYGRSPVACPDAARTAGGTAVLAALLLSQTYGKAGAAPVDDPSDAPVKLDQVTVTDSTSALSSPKFTEPLRDTPQTIAVIPSEVYNQQGATNLSDVLRNTPGITFFAGEGGSASRTGGDSFYLRGFDTSNSIYVDGVRDEGAVTRDTFNLDQVEVVKGTSSDNGRGGTAGYVNLVSKTPQLRPIRYGTVSIGADETGAESSRRATIDINEPLGWDYIPGVALRLNLMDQRGGVPGRDDAEKNRWGVAPSLALGLGTPNRAVVSYQHEKENNIPDYGLPSTVLPGSAPSAAASLYSPGVDYNNYYGFANLDRERVTSDSVLLRLEHTFAGGAVLTDQARYSSTRRYIEATSPSSSAMTPAGQVALTHGIYETGNREFSEQAGVTAHVSTGAVEHDVAAGAEFSRESSDNPIWSVVPLGAPNPNYLVDIYTPQNRPAALLNYAPHQTGSATDTVFDTLALYVFDTVKFTPAWQLVAGVRLEHYDIRESSVTAASPAISAFPGQPATLYIPAVASAAAVAAVPASQLALGADQTTASWKGGLVYKVTASGTLYASVATAVRPPGSSGYTNTLSTTATSVDNPLLQPQRAINYELGSKWGFLDERLLATIAVFRSMNSHVPSADPITGLTDQTSDQTVQGFEFSASGKVTPAWLVFAGYSHLAARVSSLISTNAQGLTLPLLPGDSGNFWSIYRLRSGWEFGGGGQYMGATRRLQATTVPSATTFSSQVPASWLFNAVLGCEVNRHLTLRLNVSNLADHRGIASLNNNGYRLNLAPPRAYLLTAEVKF